VVSGQAPTLTPQKESPISLISVILSVVEMLEKESAQSYLFPSTKQPLSIILNTIAWEVKSDNKLIDKTNSSYRNRISGT
jgi:hypothetical protein